MTQQHIEMMQHETRNDSSDRHGDIHMRMNYEQIFTGELLLQVYMQHIN